MLLPLDPRHRALLATFATAAEPYMDGIQRPTGPWRVGGATDWIDALAAAVPQVAIAAVRVELLRSIVESKLGTGQSTMGDLRSRLARLQLEPDPDGLELELALVPIDRSASRTPGTQAVANDARRRSADSPAPNR